MTITIIGAGAIGGVIGAYLAKNGEDILFVDQDENHVRKIREKGLHIQMKDQSFTVKTAAYTVAEFLETKKEVDIVLLAVKAQHTKEAIQPLTPLLGEDSFVVSFQNGLCETEIAEVVGEHRTVGCFVNLFADYIEPGKIEYGGVGSLYIGELDGQISERVQDLVDRLKCWGEAKATGNIEGYLWSKLAYGAMLTATATTNREIADFFEDPADQRLLNAVGTEVLKVAEAQEITPEPFDNWEPQLLYPNKQEVALAKSYEVLAKRLRSYTKTRTGIWRDLAVRKRRTEVPRQLGPVLKLGRQYGIEMPLVQNLVRIIEEIENGDREMHVQNIEELREIMVNS